MRDNPNNTCVWPVPEHRWVAEGLEAIVNAGRCTVHWLLLTDKGGH